MRKSKVTVSGLSGRAPRSVRGIAKRKTGKRNKQDIELKIDGNGNIHILWTDDLDLLALGECIVKRVSHVEFSWGAQGWCVYLPAYEDASQKGCLIGGPFKRREEALAWEREWALERFIRG